MAGFQQGFALIIGIANYPNVKRLPPTVLKDAKDIAAILKRPDRGGYPDDHIRVLLDDQAKKADILTALDWLATSVNVTPDATAVFYFSGHGGHIANGADAGNYLIPYDTLLRSIKKSAITSEELTAALNKIQSKRVVVLLDACYSGGTGDTKGDLEPDDNINLTTKGDLEPGEPEVKSGLDESTYDKLLQGGGRVIIASSSANEVSYVMPGAANSLFTQCLLEAIDGKAGDRAVGLVRVFDLANYVFDEVPKRQPLQNPIFKATDLNRNFPLALLLGGEKKLDAAANNTPAPSGDKHVSKSQTSLANAATTMQIKNFIIKRLQPDELDDLCSEVEAYMSEDGLNESNASPDLFPFNTSTLGVRNTSYSLQANKIIDHLNRRFKLPYLVFALNTKFPGEKITDWQP